MLPKSCRRRAGSGHASSGLHFGLRTLSSAATASICMARASERVLAWARVASKVDRSALIGTVTLPNGLTALRRSHRAAISKIKHTHTCTKAVAARETRLLEPAGQLGARHPRRGPRAGPSPTASWRGPAAILSPRSAAPTAFPPSPRPRSAVVYLCLLVTVEEIPQFDSSGHASLPESIGCRSEIDQLGGTSVLRYDNVIWN